MLRVIEGELCFDIVVIIPAFLYSLLRLLKQSNNLPFAAFLIVGSKWKKNILNRTTCQNKILLTSNIIYLP